MTILDMGTVALEAGTFGEEQTSVGTAEVVAGRGGKAWRLSFAEGAQGGLFRAKVQAAPAWTRRRDQLLGEGRRHATWSALELVDAENPRLRYQCEFSVASTEWRQVVAPWCDFLPFLPTGSSSIRGPGSGRRRRDAAVRSAGLVLRVPGALLHDRGDPARVTDRGGHDRLHTGRRATRAGAGEAAKRRPIDIVTMGDSLTSRYHWANKETCWVDRMAWKLRVHAHSEVAVVDPCMGGHQLTQGLLQMGRWLPRAPHPELVTVWFGGTTGAAGCGGHASRKCCASRWTVSGASPAARPTSCS